MSYEYNIGGCPSHECDAGGCPFHSKGCNYCTMYYYSHTDEDGIKHYYCIIKKTLENFCSLPEIMQKNTEQIVKAIEGAKNLKEGSTFNESITTSKPTITSEDIKQLIAQHTNGQFNSEYGTYCEMLEITQRDESLGREAEKTLKEYEKELYNHYVIVTKECGWDSDSYCDVAQAFVECGEEDTLIFALIKHNPNLCKKILDKIK